MSINDGRSIVFNSFAYQYIILLCFSTELLNPALPNTPTNAIVLTSTDAPGRPGSGASAVEFCQWETLNATCPSSDQVVLMTEARYGRMQFGRCVRENHGNLGCSADVLRQLDARCSGRRSCLVPVPDPSLHNTLTCPKELMPYLEAGYTCVTGRRGRPWRDERPFYCVYLCICADAYVAYTIALHWTQCTGGEN